ncbi:MAG: 3-deoxy-8-phosphooctulonate synthase [Opitutales bacterium]|nr:3-deoxy-8-phosphooctulonate synthase [Opitutales bacterium]
MSIFHPDKFLLIAGPCAIETEAVCEQVASVLATLQQQYASKLDVVFKASFDKANRTQVTSARGVGMERGLAILADIHTRYALPVTTDVHESHQAATVAKVCAMLQIPAFLCRQTDLLRAAAETGRCVSVKKGQFLSPFDMRYVAEKLQHFHAKETILMERGTTFGYGNLVVDMRAFDILKQTHCPVVFDATHSLQLPGCGTQTTGGDRGYLPSLSKAALAADADGLFVEVHPDPASAWSDSATQLPLNQLPALMEQWLALWELNRTLPKINLA